MSRILQRSVIALIGSLVALLLAVRAGWNVPERLVSRRGALKLGVAGIAVLVTRSWRGLLSARASSPVVLNPGARCVLSPEQTEGPYYISREKVRRDITEHRPGTPLRLRITVEDASTCEPIKNAAVDIWHCDSGGIYSGFIAASEGGPPGGGGPTDKRTFLRGIQFTNASGLAQFQTIYPGWYRGRTVHIHVKVHLDHNTVGHVAHTGQLYFSDSFTAGIYRVAPYRARAAARDTFNNTDAIYGDGGRQSTLSVKRDKHGHLVGSITLAVRRP